MAVSRLPILVALLAGVFASGCTTTNADEPAKEGLDDATIDQIRTRIANFATLRDTAYNENVNVLGGIMAAYSVPYLIEGLENSNDQVRSGSALALGLSQDGRAVEPLRQMLSREREEGMKCTAAFNLCLFRDPNGLPPLLKALRSDKPRYRFIANQNLMEVTGLDFGFQVMDLPERRNAAADRWDAWYRDAGPEGAALRLLQRKSGTR